MLLQFKICNIYFYIAEFADALEKSVRGIHFISTVCVVSIVLTLNLNPNRRLY